MPDAAPQPDDQLVPVNYQPQFADNAGVVAKAGQALPSQNVSADIASWPQQAADVGIKALGPLGEAGMTVGDWMRTGQVNPSDVPQAVRGHISPRAVCDFFEAKPIERAAGGRVDGLNIDNDPTEAQKEAGNYAKDHVHVHGMNITIENAKGSFRCGVDPNGKPWAVRMPAHYGYIKGTVGKDKDHVDVYLGPHLSSPRVYVVDQVNADSRKFDEHKVFVGFTSREQAESTYKRAFSDGRGADRLGHMTEMSVSSFKRWLEHGDTVRPAKELGVKIDATHDGPWMSCMAIDGRTMYRNRNVPKTATIKGKTVDVDDMLLHHEVPERDDLENLLKTFENRHHRKPNERERKAMYLKAHHRSGTPSERAHAKKIGVDWAAWSAWCRGQEAQIEKGPFTNEPKDADVKPVPHGHHDLEAAA